MREIVITQRVIVLIEGNAKYGRVDLVLTNWCCVRSFGRFGRARSREEAGGSDIRSRR